MTAFPKADRAAFQDFARVPEGLPLVIDVDGTLLHADITLESLIAYVKPNPLRLFQVIGWACRGKSHLKRQLADRVTVDTDTMPANERVVAIAEDAAKSGREVYSRDGERREARRPAEGSLPVPDGHPSERRHHEPQEQCQSRGARRSFSAGLRVRR